MLSAEDHPGIFAFLVGMIVLVMAGTGLSILADRKFKLSSSAGETQLEVNADLAEIAELKSIIQGRSKQLEDSAAMLRIASGSYTGMDKQLTGLRQRELDLKKAETNLRSSTVELEETFTRYRAEYRRKAWGGAVGEKLGVLSVLGGRKYTDCTITRVTPIGLEIRHLDGIARIQAPDLDRKLQDRFQWSDEERRRHLKEEFENQEGKPDEPAVENPEAPIEEPIAENQPEPTEITINQNAEAEAAKLRELRQMVIGWRVKVGQLSSDRSTASSQAGYGNSASVPGSLETWSARATRLGRDLARA